VLTRRRGPDRPRSHSTGTRQRVLKRRPARRRGDRRRPTGLWPSALRLPAARCGLRLWRVSSRTWLQSADACCPHRKGGVSQWLANRWRGRARGERKAAHHGRARRRRKAAHRRRSWSGRRTADSGRDWVRRRTADCRRGRRCGSGGGASARRRVLGGPGLAQVADPVVVGIASRVIRIGVPELPATEPARTRHRSDRQGSAGMTRSEFSAIGWHNRLRTGLCSHTAASPGRRSGVVVVHCGPPQISLVLRPSRCHTDCYSRD
jgi:hypothetical protein